jgi:hypothetical protein
MRFSERHGLKPVRTVFQVDSIESALQNSLWNAIHEIAFENWGSHRGGVEAFFKLLWIYHYKEPVDYAPIDVPNGIAVLRHRIFDGKWWEIYDIIEFIIARFPFSPGSRRDQFVKVTNGFLKTEMSAYRIIGGLVAKVTSEEEIEAIETASSLVDRYGPVSTHIDRALELLSDRNQPDYRNSIKESISAVESICAIITNNSKATLGDTLKQLEANGVIIHPALRGAFNQMYGYTSDAQGIRHGRGLLDEPNLDFDDAKFMLVSCSAFVNLLRARAPSAPAPNPA